MSKTSIEWTDFSVNPFRARDKKTAAVGHFCVKISPGCRNCYASRLQARFQMHEFVAKNRDNVELFLDESKLQEVIRRKKPTKYFWCDMTDMFLDDYPDEWIDKCFAVMAATPQHTHQVLTKRAERLYRYISGDAPGRMRVLLQCRISTDRLARVINRHGVLDSGFEWPLPNVWAGVSTEDQDTFNERWGWLRQTPAALRWFSLEPLLGPIDATAALVQHHYNCDEGTDEDPTPQHRCWPIADWFVVGGESGPRSRPFDLLWARDVIGQCAAANVPVFMKQVGANPIEYDDEGGAHPGQLYFPYEGVWRKTTHKKGGNWSEWPEELRVRQMPTVPMSG